MFAFNKGNEACCYPRSRGTEKSRYEINSPQCFATFLGRSVLGGNWDSFADIGPSIFCYVPALFHNVPPLFPVVTWSDSKSQKKGNTFREVFFLENINLGQAIAMHSFDMGTTGTGQNGTEAGVEQNGTIEIPRPSRIKGSSSFRVKSSIRGAAHKRCRLPLPLFSRFFR